MDEDLGAILRTIREVEASLDRRAQRALGVNLMIWGLVSASIFAFYQLVTLRHDAFHAVLGEAVSWFWLGPIALGYVASAIVGARLGRMGAADEARRDHRRALIPGLLASALAATLILTQRTELIAGGIVLMMGVLCLTWVRRHSRYSAACLATGTALVLIGGALMLWRTDWRYLIAALASGGALLGLGAWMHRAAR